MATIQETKIWIVRVVDLKTYFGLSKKGKVAKTLNLGNCQLVQGMQILYAGNTYYVFFLVLWMLDK